MKNIMNGFGPKDSFFVMLIGLPGVGKTTARKTFEEGCVVLSTDDWIEKVARLEDTTYDAVWEREIKLAERAMRQGLTAALTLRANIIIDRTNLSAKKRSGQLKQVPNEYIKVAVVFETPDEEEYRRRLDRPGKTIPPGVLGRMRENFVQPTLDEGWDMIIGVPAK